MESERQVSTARQPADEGSGRRDRMHPLFSAAEHGLLDDVPVALLCFSGIQVVAVNTEWTAMSGLGAVESEGQGWLAAIHHDDRLVMLSWFKSASVTLDGEGDLRIVPVGAEECWVRARLVSIDRGTPALRVVALTLVGAHRSVEARLLHLSTRDGLTGLENRDRLITRIRGMLAAGAGPIAVLFIDLDHFKEVNDQLGHRVGDELLKAVSRRIEGSIRSTDYIGRLGGDEFGVLCTEAPSPDEVFRLAERLGDAISAPFGLDGEVVNIDASVGVAFADDRAQTAESVLDEADQAMYIAKAAGGARWAVADGSSPARLDGDVDAADPVWASLRAQIASVERQTRRAWRSSIQQRNQPLSARLGALRELFRRASALAQIELGQELAAVIPAADDDQSDRAELLKAALAGRFVIAQAEGMIAQGNGCDVAESANLLRAFAVSRSVSVAAAAALLVGRSVEIDALSEQAALLIDVTTIDSRRSGGRTADAIAHSAPPRTPLLRRAVVRRSYDLHAAAVYGCARLICSPAEAVAVTERTFVELWRQSEWSDPPAETLRLRLVTIAHRLAMDAAITAVRARPVADETGHGVVVVSETIEAVLLRGQVLDRTIACAHLSASERSVAALVLYGRCSYTEVAQYFGESQSVVNRRLRDGLRHVRAAIGP
jgi:diguanylate cyclase (GGDEF)-like protein